MTRFRRLIAFMMTMLFLLTVVPPSLAESIPPGKTKVRLSDKMETGKSYLLASRGFALSADPVSNGGGLLAEPAGDENDLNANAPIKSSCLWSLTPEDTLYNPFSQAYLSAVNNNLILTRDETKALKATYNDNALSLFTIKEDSAFEIKLKLDISKEMFTVAERFDDVTTLEAYEILSDERNAQGFAESTSVESITLSPEALELTVGDEYDIEYTVLPEVITGTGLIWSSTAPDIVSVENGHIKALSAGQAVVSLSTMDKSVHGDCTVTVTELMHTVRFLNWDKSVIDEQKVRHGDAAQEPEKPVYEGHVFSGWDREFNVVLSDMDVTALFDVQTFTVGFYDGYTGALLKSQTVEYGMSAEAPTNPERLGYDFVGWSPSDFSHVTANMYIYATWLLHNYTITYDINGGIISPNAPKSYDIQSNVTLPTPQRLGYRFIGWHKDKSLQDSVISTIPAGTTGDITLYAEWSVISYSINYELNGGSFTGFAPTVYTVESPDILLPTPARLGYAFKGWYDNSKFSGSPISMLYSGSTGNRKYYACWEAIEYTIKYVLNGGANPPGAPMGYSTDSPDITLPTPTRTGYLFCGWHYSFDLNDKALFVLPSGSLGNITLYAEWKPEEYKIIYNVDGGTMPANYTETYTIESDDVALPKAEKTGHVLVGWYDNPELKGVAQWKIPKGSYGDKTFYANWRALIYTITFVDLDDNVIKTAYASYGTSVEPPEPPVYEGYTFTGWSEDLSFVSGNMTVKPLYKVTEYDVVFVDIDYSILSEQKVLHGGAAEAPEPPVHEGSVFAFWSCDFSCVKSNLTVIAIYRSTTVTPPVGVSNYRFDTTDKLEDGESYVIAAKSGGELYALSSLGRMNVQGLWGLKVEFKDAQFTIDASAAASIFDILYETHANNEGVILSSPTVSQSLAGDSGGLSLISSGDEFELVKSNNVFKLHNITRDNYLCFNKTDGYFYLGERSRSVSVTVYKRLSPEAQYDQSTNIYMGERYAIVAKRADGKAYLLSGDASGSGGLLGVEGVISNGRFYASHEVSERGVVFRAVGGTQTMGFNLRNAQTGGFLSRTDNGELTASSGVDKMGKWVYKTHPESGLKTLYDERSGYYLFCSENGEFSANSKISHTEILIFKHSYLQGNIGDVNSDTRVNGADAMEILRYCAKLIEIPQTSLALGDANGDGEVNTGDVIYILRYTVCLVDWLGK